MPIIYHCKTGNYLHKTKRIFDNLKDCMAHIHHIVKIRPKWISKVQINSSIYVTKIDSDELPEYERIFKENAYMSSPNGPSKSEKRSNSYKKYVEDEAKNQCAG